MLSGLAMEIWNFTREVAVYLLGGFFLAGIVRAFFNERIVRRYLGRPGFRSVFYASVLGVPLPLCSCSVIPTAAALRKGGASRAATSSFLISTPETGVDSIAVSWAMLDPLMTVARPVAALFTALVTGLAELLFNPEECQTAPAATAAPESQNLHIPLLRRLREGLHYSYFVLMADLAWYLFWGLILAGLAAWALPADLVSSLPGGRWSATAIVIAVGIPLYICATSSTPLAAALISKGLSPGLALILLLVGPATNMATLSIVYRLLGLRSVMVYLGGIIFSALACSFALDWLYRRLGIDPFATMGAAAEVMPGWLENICAVALCVLIAYGLYKEKIRPLLRREKTA
ncbi:MAG: hypothetical protein A3F83_04125 [Candidatus Glassbacteria bacterium RIFCSPLOWO2_12_FULL_58_11]|uniref:Permease n=1 Tax=Candidatus Glassbacteria bacterium RIFCSPLOWO2_12_FULL_58_11 TaxID=1817867 RepID=A0A1F5YT98_9BACT|nr:MAG: hypothetical protein A3F83_04125 [Candidatus Glassbacteria bacterium RIFCSPLOWO2_12_FULL_58_11]